MAGQQPGTFYDRSWPAGQGTREIMIINHTDCGMLRFTNRGFVYDVSTGRLSEVFADQETVTG